MKIKLRKDLPDYPAGTVFEQTKESGFEWTLNGKLLEDSAMDYWLSYVDHYSDWFEFVDETPLYWEPRGGEEYWYIDDGGSLFSLKDIEDDSPVRTRNALGQRISIGNAFPTQEAAQAHVEYLKALTRVRKYIQEQEVETLSDDAIGVEVIMNSEGIPTLQHTTNKVNPVLPKMSSQAAGFYVVNNCQDDLKTIFGVES